MPQNDGYFEESTLLFVDHDQFVAKTSFLIYRNMLSFHQAGGTLPAPGFNILYYAQSTIKWMMQIRDYSISSASKFPLECKPIRVITSPDIPSATSAIQRYIELVSKDSSESGDDFDLGYAVSLNDRLTYDDFADIVNLPHFHDYSDDDWASGFTN